ncbi:MAG: hypothetical protein WBK98_01010, partial [Limnochordia bacterium]
ELAKLIEDKLGIVVEETVKEEVAIQLKAAGPDLLLTAEAQAVLAQLVGDLVKEQLAEAKELATETIVETGVIERVVVEDVDEEVVRAIAEEVLANSLWAISEQVEANADFIDMTIAKINDRLGRLTTKVDQIGATYVSQEQLADELEALGDKMLDIEEEIAANADYVDMVFSKTNDRLGRVTRNVDLLASDVNTINGLIAALQGDVEALQASLIIETADLSDTFNKIRNEFSAELSLLGVRVGKLERLYQDLDSRVAAVEGTVAELDAKVEGAAAEIAELGAKVDEATKVQLSGSVKVGLGKTRVWTMQGEDQVDVTQVTGLLGTYKPANLDTDTSWESRIVARITEGTKASLILGGKTNLPDSPQVFDKYVLEVVSDTPINLLAVGTVGSYVGSRFDGNALAIKPGKGAVADVGLGGLTLSALAGVRNTDGMIALGAKYVVSPAFGFKLTGAAYTDAGLKYNDESSAAASIFGKVLGINYDFKVALERVKDALADKDEEEESLLDNMLFDLKLGTEIGALSVDARYTKAGATFGTSSLTTRGFIHSDAATRLGVDAAAKVFGVDLKAGTYNESDDEGEQLINSVMFNAGSE